jgi:hypothetical protein
MHVYVIQSGVPVEDIKQTVSSFETIKVTFHKLIKHCFQFHDLVDEYIELHFSNALENANLIFLSTFEGNIGNHKDEFNQLSHFPCFYRSFAVKRRIWLPNNLNGYGGSLFSPEQVVQLVRVE